MKSDKIKSMIYFLLILLEIGILFVLSRKVTKTLSRFLPISVLAIIFLPGAVIHELSHMMIAAIMFVKVGGLEFRPRIEAGGLKLGSVSIEKTDPVRRAIIGFAPVLIGISMILGVVYFVSKNLIFLQTNHLSIATIGIIGIFYILFVISTTMFSSRADMEGTLELLIVLLVIIVACYIAGFRLPLSLGKILLSSEVIRLIQKSSLFLLVPIAIDLVLLGIIKITHRRG